MQYIGKDVLTQGSLLHLDRKKAWAGLRSRAKQGIRKAQRAGIHVVESRDLSLMARVWYDPETLATFLEDNQKLYLGYLGDELVGGIIVTPITPNTLFYHYGGTNERGRAIEANAYLFWHVVEQFEKSEYEYLDIGVSFRPDLQHYFQKYCTRPYPILFRAPAEDIPPVIGLSPFTTSDLDWTEQQAVAINTQLAEYFGAEFTYLPSWSFALQSAFRALRLGKGATIGVWSSVGEKTYVEQLSQMFGDWYVFRTRDLKSQAYLVSHRWGVRCAEVEMLSTESVPLIEDCRDNFYHDGIDQHPGSFGRYAVYDLARWFPMQFGAALVGEFVPDDRVWNEFHCLDVTKRNTVRELLQIHWPRRDEYARLRMDNYRRYDELFTMLGMPGLPLEQVGVPMGYAVRTEEPYGASAVQGRIREFAVQSECDPDDGLIVFPCHQNMGPGHVNYAFGAFRGMVNPCYTYVRKDPEAV
jgi:hypothetical protein